MADVPLNHLSRPQLVHLLLRIVDLLSQPLMPAQSAPPGGSLPCGPVVEPYDASVDPWNAPDECQGDPMATRDRGVPVGTGGCHSGHGPLILRRLRSILWCRNHLLVIPNQAALGIPLACHVLVSTAKDQCLVLSGLALESYPSPACPLRMPYLGVAHGCACAAFLAVCVVHLAYYSVLVTPTTCVKFTKSPDLALYPTHFV